MLGHSYLPPSDLQSGSVAMRNILVAIAISYSTVAGAQTPNGTLRGRVINSNGVAVAGASVHLNGTTLGASADGMGNYVVNRITAGSYTVVVRRTGFAPDSFTFVMHDG